MKKIIESPTIGKTAISNICGRYEQIIFSSEIVGVFFVFMNLTFESANKIYLFTIP